MGGFFVEIFTVSDKVCCDYVRARNKRPGDYLRKLFRRVQKGLQKLTEGI